MHVRTLFALACCTTALLAQSVVVPNANAAARGSSGLNTLMRNTGQPRTYMLGINASELAGIPVGSFLVGVSFRSYVGTASPSPTWPLANVTWSDYEISIGPAIPIASFTGTFATNFASPPVLVRDGAMLLQASTPYPNNTALTAPLPNAWGEFCFDFQVPYLYLGGDLAVMFSHTGSSDPGFTYLDVVPSNAGAQGVAFSQAVFQGTSGAAADFCIGRWHYGYGAGCPGSNNMVPVLVQNQDTGGGLGGPIRLAVGNAPANTAGLFALGFGSLTIPLPNGCNLLTNPAASVLVLLDAAGRGVYTLNVPAGVVGSLNAQALVIDAGALGGFTVSNGVRPRAL